MSEVVKKIKKKWNEMQIGILKCLVLSTTQKYLVYCHRGVKKPEKI